MNNDMKLDIGKGLNTNENMTSTLTKDTKISDLLNKNWGLVYRLSDNATTSKEQNGFYGKKYFDHEITEKFLGIVRTEECEPEYTSKTEQFIFNLLEKNKNETMQWLNGQFLKQFKNTRVIVNILIAISHMPYDMVFPNGPTMVVCATRHESIEVQENAIRVFEKWANEDSLNYLSVMSFKEEWIQDYLKEVIVDIKEGIAENVSIG